MILGVNIDHVATLRQARLGTEPEPLMAATLALLAGADGITVHLREDRRHINDRDLYLMRELVTTELNLEMAATGEMVEIALEVRPDMVTLVPEKRRELTTEGGLNVRAEAAKISKAIKALHEGGIPVSLFINPDKADIKASAQAGADMVEIHTGVYAGSKGAQREKELKRVEGAVKSSLKAGLAVNAGHGLDYSNVKDIASIEGLRGLYIGHSVVSRAVLVGMSRAVREMKKLIREAL